MNNSVIREQIGCDVICRSHSARTERDLYRICPSKLSKRELEDLYFALLENNLELKKTVNIQQDKIKVLSTRVQRMTVTHRSGAGKEKNCCASKAVVSEQKESISDLKKTNERMAERIRLLNMRLCSAKQFLKRSPSQASSTKACNRSSFKNSSLSALNPKRSESNMRQTAVSCQFLDKDVSARSTKTVETATEKPDEEEPERLCNENKCRTMMDDMKEKIVNLQEELSTTHDEYSLRISKLELQVNSLQDENTRVQGERVASEHAMHQRAKRAGELADQLRTKDAQCNELNMELSIERRKVTELETGLKLANMSSPVAATIQQLTAMNDSAGPGRESSLCSHCSQAISEQPSHKTLSDIPSESPKAKEDIKFTKSDDSGCTDLNKSCDVDEDTTMLKLNQDLLKKIAELQTQLDVLRISAAGEAVVEQEIKPKEFESCSVEIKDVDEAQIPNTQDSLHSLPATTMETQQNVAERDKVTSPPQGASETEATTSKPADDFHNTNRTDQFKNATHNIKNMKSESSITIKEADMTDMRASNDDADRDQVPGPMPSAYIPPPSQDMRTSRRNRPSRDPKTSPDTNCEREKTVRVFQNSRDSVYTSVKATDSEKNGKAHTIMSNLKVYAKGINEMERKKDLSDKKSKSVSITDVEGKLSDRTPTRDSILVHKKKLITRSEADEQSEDMSEVKHGSTTSFLLKCEDSVQVPRNSGKAEQATEMQLNADHYDICESRAVICRCPALATRDAVVYRSCSGTLRFRTTTASDRLRHCGCPGPTQIDASVTTNVPPEPARRDSATYTAPVEARARDRATSPDSTDHEISSLTDLPSENAKSPRVLSPGEDKGTMYTDTETAATDYGSLSEGELPNGTVRRLSAGERPSIKRPYVAPPVSPSQKIEATLQSISTDLARCRRLLLSQRPQEDSSSRQPEARSVRGSETAEAGLALRSSVAARRLVDTRAPSCLFTLHIGTLVLSDEALAYSRGKALVLRWQFYSQTAGMARVQPGRVLPFDLLTEYEVVCNEHLLDYMKRADMAIVLCSLDDQEQPLAACSLPLREALLHANRRTDMSLALVASEPAPDGIVGEEIGVLDLWCSLRVDPALLCSIHAAMRTQSPVECHSNPLRSESRAGARGQGTTSRDLLSRDLDFSTTDPGLLAEPVVAAGMVRKFPSDDMIASISEDPSSRYEEEVQQYRPARSYRRRSSQAQKSIASSDLGHKGQVGFDNNWPTLHQESSGIIINEVPATIKSTEELKHALERNAHLNQSSRLPKMEDDTSQAHYSISSVKNLAAKHHFSKLRWPRKKPSNDTHVDSLQEFLKKDKGSFSSSAQPAASTEGYIKDECEMPAPKKSEDITIGMNRLVEAAKKSVKYTDSPSREEPQKKGSTDSGSDGRSTGPQSIDITILWLALNEECEAMLDPAVQRLYVAYSFLSRRGAELETPVSLPKPRHYADKCYFNFKQTFHLHESDLPLLGHMSRCRAGGGASTDPRDCLVFTLVSEPPEDPLGLSACEDIGYAYLYLGDVLAYSGGSGGYTEVVGVRGVHGGVCGVLAVRVDNLPVLRRALALSHSQRDLPRDGASSDSYY